MDYPPIPEPFTIVWVQDALAIVKTAVTALESTSGDLAASLANLTSATIGKTTAVLGFFGKTPAPQPGPLTQANTGVLTNLLNVVLTVDIINNNRTRISEMETALKALGLLK